MKTILLACLLALPLTISAQTKPDSLVWRYADLTYPTSGFSSKAKVVVDYGELVTGWFRKPELIESPDGKAIKFRSPVDALNFMSTRGWELVQSYQTAEDVGLGIKVEYIHFIMRRMEPFRIP